MGKGESRKNRSPTAFSLDMARYGGEDNCSACRFKIIENSMFESCEHGKEDSIVKLYIVRLLELQFRVDVNISVRRDLREKLAA